MIVSNDGANTTAQRLGRGVVTVIPVTSNITHVYPFQTLLAAEETGLDVDSKAQAEQVRSVAVERIGTLIGSVRNAPTSTTGSVRSANLPTCHSDEMIELVLTIIGRDRAGVVASLADVVRFHEGNWKRSELAEIAGTFAGVVVVEVGDDRVDELLTNLLVLRDQGLHVTAQQVEEPVVAPDTDEVRLRLTGDDRPGIVHEVSTAISEAGISISRLGTVTDLPGKDGGRGFEITAQLTVPVEVDLDAVLDSLGEVAVRLGIALNVEDLTGDDAEK